jgi:hypothetical protein
MMEEITDEERECWARERKLADAEAAAEADWPGPEDDPAYLAWCEEQEARGELAGVAETAPCYECGQEARKGIRDEPFEEDPSFMLVDCKDGKPVGAAYPLPFITRKIVKLGPVVEQRRDPTQSYVLECGHTTI